MGKWIEWLVATYHIDSLRLDAVKHIRKDFWPAFITSSNATFAIGEVYSNNVGYVADYQKYVGSLFNFPLYFTLLDVFTRSMSMKLLQDKTLEIRAAFKDSRILGNFLDNQDLPRFFSKVGQGTLFTQSIITH